MNIFRGCSVCRSIDHKIAAATEEMRSLRQRLADSLIRWFEYLVTFQISNAKSSSTFCKVSYREMTTSATVLASALLLE